MESLISIDECEIIIQRVTKEKSTDIENYAIKKIGDEYPGFLGEYFELTVNYKDVQKIKSTKTFFVKSLPLNNPNKREHFISTGIFGKECEFFEKLLPKLIKYSGSKWYPECFYTRSDLLVLEDLKFEYKTLPIKIDFTEVHMYEALKCLAIFHCSSLIYERAELKPKNITIGETCKEFLYETSYKIDNPWNITGFNCIKMVAMEKTKYGRGTKYENLIETEYLKRLLTIYEMIEKPTVDVVNVCCHRDIWTNNLMFKFEKTADGQFDFQKPKDCLIIDFQIARYLPLVIDVLACIIIPTRKKHHQEHISKYLEFYYDQLNIQLAKQNFEIESVLKWDAFKKTCDYYMLLPLVMSAMFKTLTHLPSDKLGKMMDYDEESYIRICNDFRDDLVLEYLEKDEFYRDCLVEAVEELIEFLFVKEL